MNARTLSLALAAPFCWGTSFTLAKPTLDHFSPLLMMLFAYAFVAIATLPSWREKSLMPWHHSAAIATLGVTMQGALLFWGVQGVDATTSNLLLQTQVPAAVFMGWLLAGEKLTKRKLIGTAVALAGIAIVIGLPDRSPPMLPVVLIVVSGIIWSLAQVLVRKLSRDSGLLVLRNNAIFSLPQLLVCTYLLEHDHLQQIQSASALQWALLAFVGIVGFYLAYAAWFSLLRRVPVDEAAPFVLLMTPFGLLTAVLFLHERMSPAQIVGAVILMAGLAIVTGWLPSQQKTPA